jgi:hypothetical protein
MIRYERTVAEIIESTAYGKLYRIKAIHGARIIAHRVRKSKGKLYSIADERVTLEQTETCTLPIQIDDFVFKDTKNEWCLWHVEKRV